MKPPKKNVLMIAAAVLVAGAGLVLWQMGVFGHVSDHPNGRGESRRQPQYPRPRLLHEEGKFGLALSKDAIQSLEIKPITVELARVPIELPPTIGTINYDNARLFQIKPRFTGEVVALKQYDETRETIVNGSTVVKTCERPMKFGDTIKQGQTAVVMMSPTLGQQKAAFVDTIINLRMSETILDRHKKLYEKAGLPELTLLQTRQKVAQDTNAMNSAEGMLRTWKLTDSQIKEIRDEANTIHDQKLKRDPKKEAARWARVEVPVPWFDRENPDRELTVVEMNTHVNDMVDPANFATPLMKVADLRRLQIWAHPPEEYLPLIQERLKPGAGGMKWRIRFQAEPASAGVPLEIAQISPSLEPNQHTPMVIGYLPNPSGKHLIGQFVTATILMPPPADTVAVPTEAINQLEGKDYVFAVKPGKEGEFFIRRVAVAQSFKKVTYVRAKLTPHEEQANQKLGADEYPFEPLTPGERIVNRCALELTAALDEARNVSNLSQQK